ncbi:hypothetical protein [Kineococcus sp. SYSU DK005]
MAAFDPHDILAGASTSAVTGASTSAATSGVIGAPAPFETAAQAWLG